MGKHCSNSNSLTLCGLATWSLGVGIAGRRGQIPSVFEDLAYP